MKKLINFYTDHRSQKTTKNDITVFDKSVLSIINKNAKIEYLSKSFIVAEGPLWDTRQNRLIFTDVRQNKIFTWDENNGVGNIYHQVDQQDMPHHLVMVV